MYYQEIVTNTVEFPLQYVERFLLTINGCFLEHSVKTALFCRPFSLSNCANPLVHFFSLCFRQHAFFNIVIKALSFNPLKKI